VVKRHPAGKLLIDALAFGRTPAGFTICGSPTPKSPDPKKVEEYDQTRRFCRIIFFMLNKLAEQHGERSFFPEELPDSW